MEASNIKAMREVLEEFVEYSNLVCKMGMFNRDRLVSITKKARESISAPPRNCDVGTADEQHARFYSFCDKFEKCKECPLWRGGGLTSKCSVYWAQMPYEEGGEK